MDRAARIDLQDQDGVAVLEGDWTATEIGDQDDALKRLLEQRKARTLDLTRVGRFDTAGALAVVRATGGEVAEQRVKTRPETRRLLDLIAETLKRERKEKPRPNSAALSLDKIGRGLANWWDDVAATLAFNGHLLVAVGRTIRHPGRLRWASIATQVDRSGLDAIPIVAVTSFFIGAVVGLLGANMLRQFGAQVFAVELIGIAVLREFSVIITAVLLAGRSASSFTAEIGAMKMNQEIDAMQVLGVDPFEALVMPRFIALLLMIPLLTFVAALAGLAGGMLVSWTMLDLSPNFFVQRILDNVGATQFYIGLSKTPVVAAVIAAIGCRQGLEVGGDVESLGQRVTASVVHAIFSIILIDAVFALIYMQLNL